MKLKLVSVVLLGTGLVSAEPAAACPEGQSKGAFGMCFPNIGGSVGQSWEHIKRETQGQLVGNPLAIFLQQSRDSARGTSMPLPPYVRQAMTGFLPEGVLNAARYKVGDNGVVNAAAAAMALDSNVAGVTLLDTIVFRDGQGVNDLELWAHELTHVRQYLDSGNTRDFAIRYSRDKGGYEGDAERAELNFRNWAANRSQSGPSPSPFPVPPQRVAAACYTQQGTCPMRVAKPQGAPCMCVTYWGNIPGQAF